MIGAEDVTETLPSSFKSNMMTSASAAFSTSASAVPTGPVASAPIVPSGVDAEGVGDCLPEPAAPLSVHPHVAGESGEASPNVLVIYSRARVPLPPLPCF